MCHWLLNSIVCKIKFSRNIYILRLATNNNSLADSSFKVAIWKEAQGEKTAILQAKMTERVFKNSYFLNDELLTEFIVLNAVLTSLW